MSSILPLARLINFNDANWYNRVLGVDYNLASADNTWTGKFYLHKSLQPDDSRGNHSAQGRDRT